MTNCVNEFKALAQFFDVADEDEGVKAANDLRTQIIAAALWVEGPVSLP